MVFNHVTYPNMIRWFQVRDVKVVVRLCASCDVCRRCMHAHAHSHHSIYVVVALSWFLLLQQHGVEIEESDMSFGVSVDKGSGPLEWASTGLQALYAQKSNFVNPQFQRMVQPHARTQARSEG